MVPLATSTQYLDDLSVLSAGHYDVMTALPGQQYSGQPWPGQLGEGRGRHRGRAHQAGVSLWTVAGVRGGILVESLTNKITKKNFHL